VIREQLTTASTPGKKWQNGWPQRITDKDSEMVLSRNCLIEATCFCFSTLSAQGGSGFARGLSRGMDWGKQGPYRLRKKHCCCDVVQKILFFRFDEKHIAC
jgi:hypothetical protein